MDAPLAARRVRGGSLLRSAILISLCACGGDAPAPPEPPTPAGPPDVPTPVLGEWLGSVRGWSLRITLTEGAERAIQGSGTIVGRWERFDVTGALRGDRVELTLDFGGGLLATTFTGRLSGSTIPGSLDGSGFHDDPLPLARLGPSHPARRGVEWSLVSTTPDPDALRGIIVAGDVWLAPSLTGLRLSRDEGATWVMAVEGSLGVGVSPNAVAVHPTRAGAIAVGRATELFVTEDGGRTWEVRSRLAQSIASVHVADDGTIWVGARASGEHAGIYRSRGWQGELEEVTFDGRSAPDLIPWVVFQVPTTGTVLVATELGTHPTPYDPPFFRSTDRGRSWRDVSGDVLWWHSVEIAFDRRTGTLYTLQEGPGLYRSRDDGSTWEEVADLPAMALWIGSGDDRTIMVGEIVLGRIPGGAYRSMDGGVTFEPAGFVGRNVWGFARDRRGRLLAAVEGGGVYATSDL